jgi:hypothetical protein
VLARTTEGRRYLGCSHAGNLKTAKKNLIDKLKRKHRSPIIVSQEFEWSVKPPHWQAKSDPPKHDTMNCGGYRLKLEPLPKED